MTADDDTLNIPGPVTRVRVADAISRLPVYLTPEELKLARNGRSIRLTQEQALDVADRALAALLEEKDLNVNAWLAKANGEWSTRAGRAEEAREKDARKALKLIAAWRTLAGTGFGSTTGAALQYQLHFSHLTSVLIILPVFAITFYWCIRDLT